MPPSKKKGSNKKNKDDVPQELPPIVGWKPRPDSGNPLPEPQHEILMDEEIEYLSHSELLMRAEMEQQLELRRLFQNQLDAMDMNTERQDRVHLPPVSSAPITTQKYVPTTQESAMPHSSTTTTTTATSTTITALPQPPHPPHPPVGPRPPNVPKRNVGNREAAGKQCNYGRVVMAPPKPEQIGLDMPPVIAPKPQPPSSKPEGNRRRPNKFRKTTQKSAKHGRRTTKPADEQPAGSMKPHPPVKPKPERLLHKRPQISNTEKIYVTTDQGEALKIMSDDDDHCVKDEIIEKVDDEDDSKKPAVQFTVTSRPPSSEPKEIPEEIPEEINEELSA